MKEGHGLGIDNPLYEPTTPSETFFVLAGDGPKPLEEKDMEEIKIKIKNLKLNSEEKAEVIVNLDEIPFPIIDSQRATNCGCHAINNLLGEENTWCFTTF